MTGTRKTILGNVPGTTLASGISNSATSIVIASATGWPTGSDGPFAIKIDRGLETEETILIASRAGTTLTVDTSGRGYDGTTAAAHDTSARVEHVVDAVLLDEANRLASVMTARGDIIYEGASGPARLAKGTPTHVLLQGVNDPEWGQVTAGGIANATITAAKLTAAGRAGIIPSYADKAARDAELTAPADGMLAYLEDTDRLTLRQAGAWIVLAVGTGTWTPALTNIAVGTGGSVDLSAAYSYTPGQLMVNISAVLGTSDASVSGEPTFSLPSGFTALLTGNNITNGVNAIMSAGGSGNCFGDVRSVTSSTLGVRVIAANGVYVGALAITPTVPGTWAAGSFIRIKCPVLGTLAD